MKNNPGIYKAVLECEMELTPHGRAFFGAIFDSFKREREQNEFFESLYERGGFPDFERSTERMLNE